MELLRRLRARTDRAASRLSREGGTHTRWAQRGRILLYVVISALLMWEVFITQYDDHSTLLLVVRVGAVLTLYGIGRWPVMSAAVAVPLIAAEFYLGFNPLSMTMLVPLTFTGLLISTRPRPLGYLYALGVAVLITRVSPTDNPLADFANWSFVFLFPCIIGEAVRFMLKSVDRIAETSVAHLARQRRDLARELHDTSIHDITAMIMALERAKLAGISDPKVLEEIDHAIATGRQSVVSMRGVLKILRTEDDGVVSRTTEGMPAAIAAATPTVQGALEDARASLARTGLELRVHLEDHIDQPMPFSVRTALVRIIQECTANMAKYARPGQPCTVMIERTDAETRALFINEAAGDAKEDAALSSGVGLIGVRERVEAVGGSLAIRHHGGRWIIQASIPTISSMSEGQVERAAQH